MAAMDSSPWNEQGHGLPGADDDFQQFLEMSNMSDLTDGMQFDLPGFPNNGQHMMHQLQQGDSMDTTMGGTDALHLDPTATQAHMPTSTTSTSYASIPTTLMPMSTASVTAISDIDAQILFLQQQKAQQQQRQMNDQQAAFFMQSNRGVPPTPQSLDLQAVNGQFYVRPDHTPTQAQQELFDRFQRLREQQDMAFTPLASPAVTPMDAQFSMVDTSFAVPATYFSPLTSPALHPQIDHTHVYDRSMATQSNSPPDDADFITTTPTDIAQQSAERSKDARKSNGAKPRPKSQVGKSPIVKPQRRKTASMAKLTSQVFTELSDAVQKSSSSPALNQQVQARRRQATSSETSNTSMNSSTESENDSVSPEALSDMPPPPLPKSRIMKPSPQIQPHGGSKTSKLGPSPAVRAGKPSPATPASLMKLASPKLGKTAGTGEQEAIAVEHIDELELPEAVSSGSSQRLTKLSLTPISITSPSGQVSQSEPSSAISAFQPLPSPSFVKSPNGGSQLSSPQLGPWPSSSMTPANRRTPHMGPRNSKKRGSISVSPALRPRISPNIRPLLPGGDTAEDAASRLLTTKSNYQNILEGNRVPGVSYPSELSTNLTSKRTSHKIAEQGRRNRINSALQEIATLLPKSALKELKESEEGENSGDKKDGKNGGTPNSKASTVELAIEYIKQLQAEVAEANKRADEAEEKLKVN